MNQDTMLDEEPGKAYLLNDDPRRKIEQTIGEIVGVEFLSGKLCFRVQPLDYPDPWHVTIETATKLMVVFPESKLEYYKEIVRKATAFLNELITRSKIKANPENVISKEQREAEIKDILERTEVLCKNRKP